MRAFARHMEAHSTLPGEVVPVQEVRRRAAAARVPLNAGGPRMAETRGIDIPAGSGVSLPARIYRPLGSSREGVLLYLHGGGWILGSIDTHDRLMRTYAAMTGLAVVGLDYSLAPEAPFPRALDESVTAIRFLRRIGSEFGLSGSLVIGGDSAGANLAVSACLRLLGDSDEPPAAMLLNYGVYDRDFDTPSYSALDLDGAVLTAEKMRWFWESYVGPAATGPLLAPLHADLRGMPAAFLAVADLDVLRSENLAFADALCAQGVACQVAIYPGTIHAFLEAAMFAPCVERALADQSAFLAEVVSKP
jgi:acetyl esterase